MARKFLSAIHFRTLEEQHFIREGLANNFALVIPIAARWRSEKAGRGSMFGRSQGFEISIHA